MKKFLGLFFAVFAVFLLVACNGKEYKHDGEFTAFEVGTSYGAPQVTWVTVTIKKGKIHSYYIDELQSKITEGVFAWNAKTKKELKEEYGMVGASPIEKEWFEQAEAIEAKWLADGVDSVLLNEAGEITNLADATMIGTTYNKMAKESLKKAKAGVATAFEVGTSYGAPQVTWVEAKFEKGKVTSYYIDELQSEISDGVFAWNAKTKKELKEEYGMVGASPIEKEWFEQAAAIEAKWLADGVDSVLLNEAGKITNLADATMIGTTYNKLAKKAVALVK